MLPEKKVGYQQDIEKKQHASCNGASPKASVLDLKSRRDARLREKALEKVEAAARSLSW